MQQKEEVEAKRPTTNSLLLQKEEARKGGRNGDFNEFNRLKSGVKGFKDGRNNTRAVTMV